MPHSGVNHLFHLSVGGGDRHRFAILYAAEAFASAEYKVHDTTMYTTSPYRPDLVVSKQDRFIDGPRRRNRNVTYWVEVVDTSDPPRDFVRPPGEIIRIDISKCKTYDEVVDVIKRSIP